MKRMRHALPPQPFLLLMLLLMLALLLPLSPPALAADDYPTNKGELIGPHKRLGTDAGGFTLKGNTDTTPHCAGKNSVLSVIARTSEKTIVRFVSAKAPGSAFEACAALDKHVTENAAYEIKNADFDTLALKDTGVAFGALIVPFKFRMGDDKKISSSTTIAPYIGVRWYRLQGFGVEFMPVVSAGLALVPVTDQTTRNTETKAAFSLATGITLSSRTNTDFSAGLLVGKDFLSKSDRQADPSVNKLWISIWLGVSR
ncbi:hypothetical protein QPK32_15170 [Massilia sp. YIM B02763]|uniref:hypothetical protein n=1 Tax=Massilia sp. YIM B02763 TaxID=3050130 RepID=UPI0025B6EF64|nr:hypothetical protein [Massilia sp. YIM B02763]MDN4054422.1 hypothetical protein [Massilia sp. YIM B02763]